MDNKIKKHLCMKLGLVTVVAVLVSGFGVSSVYGRANTNTLNFQSDFETTAIPLCGGEAVTFGGTVHFAFHETVAPDGSIHTFHQVNYQKTSGVGTTSGDRYQINEVDHFSLNEPSNPTVVHSVITGKLVHNGKGTDTGATINLLTVFDSQGVPKTTVDHVDIRCNGAEA